jgi:hypothetical protein
MDGIVEELLRLEGAKNKALIACDARAYDEHVRAQLHLLDSASDLKAAAQKSPEALATLSKLIHHNTSLFLNLVSTSALFAMNQNCYSAKGDAQTHISARIAVEA